MYLGIDLGTTNVKAVIVEDSGRIAARFTDIRASRYGMPHARPSVKRPAQRMPGRFVRLAYRAKAAPFSCSTPRIALWDALSVGSIAGGAPSTSH